MNNLHMNHLNAFFGQTSNKVGDELLRISKYNNMADSVIFNVENQTGQVAKARHFLEPSIKVSPRTDSWSDGYYIYQTEEIPDKLSMIFEKSDSLQKMLLVFDTWSGLGSGMSSAILEDITIFCPSLHVSTVGLFLPHAGGLSILNSLLGMQYCLEYSSSVLLRGIEDAMLLAQEASSVEPILQFSPVHSCIASDLYSAICPNVSHISVPWYADVCSSKTKIIDIRTSLWKSSLFKASSNTTRRVRCTSVTVSSDVNPIRIMTTNLHTSYLTQSYSDNRITISQSKFVCIQPSLPQNTRKITNTSANIVRSPEMLSALHWATPNITWSSIETNKSKINSSNTGASSSLVAPGEDLALGYVCPFSVQRVQSICDKAYKLMKCKAYVHRFSKSIGHHLELDDLTASLEYVRMAIN